MRKIITGFVVGLALTTSAAVEAHGHRGPGPGYGWHHRSYNPGWWVAPAVIGGVVTYAVTRPYIDQTVIVQQPQVVLQPNQVLIDGIVYTKQIMIINGVQQEILVRQ